MTIASFGDDTWTGVEEADKGDDGVKLEGEVEHSVATANGTLCCCD